MFKKYFLILISLLCTCTHAHYPFLPAKCAAQYESQILSAEPRLHIIFDFGGVLINPNKKAFMHSVGTLSLISLALKSGNPQLYLMEQLDALQPHAAEDPVILDDRGNRLPSLMIDWLSGRSGKEILQTMSRKIDLQSTIGRMMQAIFDAESFIQNQCIDAAGERFVREVAIEHFPYALSNWDKDSFVLMRERHASFLNLFVDTLISGNCGLCKPDVRIYQELITRNDLDPRLCVFIDNQEENVKAAQAVGMHAILFTDWKSVRRQLHGIQEDIKKSAWYAAQQAYTQAGQPSL